MTDKRISDAIEQVINENTFAPAALKAMQVELDKVRALEADKERHLEKIKVLEDDNRRVEQLKDAAIKRAEQAQDLANANAEDRVALAAAKATAETYAKCFELVFRNAQINRSVTSSVPVGDSSGYVSPYVMREDIAEEQK